MSYETDDIRPSARPRLSVSVDGGKYRYVMGQDGGSHVYRHDERWRDTTGDNLIYSLAFELDEARSVRRRLEARWQAHALENFASRIEHLYGLTSGKRLAEEARRAARLLRQTKGEDA